MTQYTRNRHKIIKISDNFAFFFDHRFVTTTIMHAFHSFTFGIKTAILCGSAVLLSGNLSAQNMTNSGCTVTANTVMTPMTVTDCDHSENEFVDWTEPTATATGACGPITTIQTAGPTRMTEAIIGQFEVVYTFMAVDKTTMKVVQTSTKTTLTVLANDTTPPVIGPLAAQNAADKKVPNLAAILAVSDNCTANKDLKITQIPAAGTDLTAETTVKITVTDQAGNEAQTSVSVTPR